MEKELKEPKTPRSRATRCRSSNRACGEDNDNIPKISKMQIDLMVNSFAADFARVATLQITNSVGGARMKWLASTKGTTNCRTSRTRTRRPQEKLTKINKWYCEQLAYLAKRLAETPEPGGSGSLLDNTMIVWTNELGKGNSHTLDNIPFVLVGGGLDFKMGRVAEVPEGAAQPAADVAGARVRAHREDVRQPEPLRRGAARWAGVILWGRLEAGGARLML